MPKPTVNAWPRRGPATHLLCDPLRILLVGFAIVQIVVLVEPQRLVVAIQATVRLLLALRCGAEVVRFYGL